MSVKRIETIPREALVKISGADGEIGGDEDVDRMHFISGSARLVPKTLSKF